MPVIDQRLRRHDVDHAVHERTRQDGTVHRQAERHEEDDVRILLENGAAPFLPTPEHDIRDFRIALVRLQVVDIPEPPAILLDIDAQSFQADFLRDFRRHAEIIRHAREVVVVKPVEIDGVGRHVEEVVRKAAKIQRLVTPDGLRELFVFPSLFVPGVSRTGGPFLAVSLRLLFAIDTHDETVQRDAFLLHVRQMLFQKINRRIAPRPVQHLHLPRLGQRRHHDAACASENKQSFHHLPPFFS